MTRPPHCHLREREVGVPFNRSPLLLKFSLSNKATVLSVIRKKNTLDGKFVGKLNTMLVILY